MFYSDEVKETEETVGGVGGLPEFIAPTCDIYNVNCIKKKKKAKLTETLTSTILVISSLYKEM